MPVDFTAIAGVALAEDAPRGDITTRLVVPDGVRCTAELVAKQPGVIAGTAAALAVFELAANEDGAAVSVDVKVPDGARVAAGDQVAVIRGPAATLLRAERPAINLLAHLSGIATLTRAFVDAAAPARILCTRKTTPGLREPEREAVTAGGGVLHRATLSDAVLVKDTHVFLAGGVAAAVRRAKTSGVPVEVEVESLRQLEEATAEGADTVLLDNPTPDLVRRAIEQVGDPSRVEVSGGVTLENVRSFVDAGARLISVGRLTHSAPALDLSLEVIDVGD